MYVPGWVVWVVVAILAIPCLWVLAGVFLFASAVSEDAKRNAEKRTREATEVLECPDCRPLLPRAKCAAHRWHTTPPPEYMPEP